jgi:hypothetical protein
LRESAALQSYLQMENAEVGTSSGWNLRTTDNARESATLVEFLKTLDKIYAEAMERIERQYEARKQLAKQVLMWLTCAFRPLSARELQHALAVELNTTSLDLGAVYYKEILISVCEGLVVTDEEQNVIRFARKSQPACRDGLDSYLLQTNQY